MTSAAALCYDIDSTFPIFFIRPTYSSATRLFSRVSPPPTLFNTLRNVLRSRDLARLRHRGKYLLGTKRKILISDFCLTPKNDLRTKRKSCKPTFSSENEIEKWPYMRQSPKRYRFSKAVEQDKQRIFVLGWKWRGRVDSCLDPA